MTFRTIPELKFILGTQREYQLASSVESDTLAAAALFSTRRVSTPNQGVSKVGTKSD